MADHQHIAYLDGWRGAAILALLAGHFFPVDGINLGSLGVNLFFVLSGMLMTKILFVSRQPLGTFYRRRFARIFPSVYVFLILTSCAFLLASREISPLELLSAASFTNNYILPEGQWRMPFGHIWSLSVEEHAYVLLSLVALLTGAHAGKARWALAGIALASAALACLYWLTTSEAALVRLWPHTEVAAFGIFFSGLVFLLGRAGGRSARESLAVPLLLMLGVAAHWWSVPPPLRLVIGCGAFALALDRLRRAPAILVRALEFAPLRQLGIWSFSLYLWQQPFYQLVRHAGMHPALGLALSLLAGGAAYYLVEKPARAWINARWSAPIGAAVAQPAAAQAQRTVG